MSKILDFAAHKGQLIDKFSNKAFTNSGCSLKQTEKGLSLFIESGNSLTLTGLSLDVINIISLAKGIGTLRISVGANNTDIVLTDNSFTETKSVVSFTSETSITISCTSGFIYISRVILFDVALTVDETNTLTDSFEHLYPLAESKRNFYFAKPTSLSENGLVAAYNMIPSANKVLPDISGNGNNGTINGPLSTLEGMSFDGVDDYIAATSTVKFGSSFTINMRIKAKNPYQAYAFYVEGNIASNPSFESDGALNKYNFYLRDYSGSFVSIQTPILLQTEFYNISMIYDDILKLMKLYIDGSLIGTKSCNAATYSLLLFNIGRKYNVLYNANGKISDFKLYNRVLSEKEIKDYNNSFANQIYYKNNFEYEKADGTNIIPESFTQGTGSFKIATINNTDATSLMPVKENYLECTGNGTIKIPYNQSTSVDAEMKFYTAGSWAQKSDTLSNLITSESWLSQSVNYLVLTMTYGQRIADILIKKGIIV